MPARNYHTLLAPNSVANRCEALGTVSGTEQAGGLCLLNKN